MKKQRLLAIIPARGGSKRVPRKNVKLFNAKPMIAWTIKAAKDSGLFTDIVVSTDSDAIAKVALKHGAEVPFLRQKTLSDDYTPVHAVSIDALKRMEDLKEYKYDAIVQLMPNCPCRTAQDIKQAYQHFCKHKANFQISVFEYGWMNPWWAMKMDPKSALPKALFPKALKMRSQDLPSVYCPTGAIWIARPEPLCKSGTFYGPGHIICPMPWTAAVDIDTPADWQMADIIFKSLNKRSLC